MKEEGFPKRERLKEAKDFTRVFQQGKRTEGRFALLFSCKGGEDTRRIGIVVKKRLGKAVLRHRITRLLREIYRKNKKSLIPGVELVLLAKKGSEQKSYLELEQDILDIFKKARIIKEEG